MTSAIHHLLVPVSEQHCLAVSTYGHPTGLPVLFVHGGPGGGTSPECTQFFDLDHYYVILVDQRGCGKSTPHASLEHNTTAHLVEDFEIIRKHLNIAQWIVFGGSWGSTLGLVYAQQYPQHVMRLVLRGIFLGDTENIAWLTSPNGAAQIWPEHWQDLNDALPGLAQANNPVDYLYKLVTSTDQNIQANACAAFARWEGSISQLVHHRVLAEAFATPPLSTTISRLELHYMQHNMFLRPSQILKALATIKYIPIDIVHGRYDVVCPIQQAFTLYDHLIKVGASHANLHVVDHAGHSAFDPALKQKLCEIMTQIAKKTTE